MSASVQAATGRIPNDEDYSEQYGMELIQAPEAWAIETGKKSVRVAVLDTGIDYTHPDLAKNINQELALDTVNGTDTMDYYGEHGHGTHVGGIIGAIGNNGRGVAGVCWDVELVSVKIYPVNSSITHTDALARGIQYAIDEGFPIINLSMQNYDYDTTCADRLAEYPGLVVICAGNYNRDIDTMPCYPASYDFDNIIAVGNSTKDDEKYPNSNHGKQTVDLFAPGTNIYSTVIGGDYDFDTGTSMSAPHVAGTAALLLSYNPNLTTSELKEAILESVDPIDALSSYCSTGGRLNTYNALRYIYDDDAVVVNDYEQLKEALAGSATKIRIAQDITLEDTLTISRSVSLTPYGTESVTLTAADGKRHFLTRGDITIDLMGIILYGGGIENNGTLTLNGGKITGNTSFTDGGGIANFGRLTINSGEISGNTATNGGGIYNRSSISVLTINGGKISGNTATYGAGVYNRGTLTINGGEVSGNTATSGAGIYDYGKLTTINGGEISGNTANNSGGGIYNYTSTLTINDGEISNNTAKYWGGGIYNRTSTTLTINGGKIGNNTAGSYGGGIDNNNAGMLTIYDGEISSNNAKEGGGIYNRGGTDVTINGGMISANTASTWGGGVFNDANTTLTINGGEISDNTARLGGGIYLWYTYGTVTINGGEICGNTASNMGGGIYSMGNQTVTINGGKISGNTAALWGGGIDNLAIMIINDGEISNNTAVGGGGGIQNSYGTLTINGGKISNNTATGSSTISPKGAGGGILNNKGLVIITEGEICNNAAAVHGGGIYNLEESEVIISGGAIFDNSPDDTYGF